jgi:hypothetical protein
VNHLPGELSAGQVQVSLRLTRDSPAKATIQSTVQIETQQVVQLIHLQHDGNGWHIHDAQLNQAE